MSLKAKDIQLQYEGFLNTPLLWNKNSDFGLTQFEIKNKKTQQFNSHSKPEIRLGKRVEQFSFHTFEEDKTITILSENIQIQDGKRTVGEIDCLLLKNGKPFHIEIIYKFYLYDESVGETEIEHWIGPNRRDSLFQKLTKLKEKQLPLLTNEFTKPHLDSLNLNSAKIVQQVYFKAQLFVPFKDFKKTFLKINNDCINGFYIHKNELSQFKDCKFHIPQKLNWLQEIQTQINWLNFLEFDKKIELFHAQKSAPLCWLKNPNGTFQKFFVVWWD